MEYILVKGKSHFLISNGKISYVFKHGERIISEDKGELWEECFKFTRALISIFTEVINHPIIKKYSFIEDITATGYI